MGNWRNRPHGGFYHQDRAPKYPPPYHDSEPSLSEFCNDGVPLWEKKFCTSVGGISWQKIVDAKKFMCYNDNVLNWDDSAAEEAFKNAKKRYWAMINGFTCDIPAPDPNAYIDEINWNPYIDPELIRDIEYFAHDEENDGKVGHENKMARNLSPAPSDKVENPWECNNVTQGVDGSKDLLGRGQLVTKVDESMNLNSNGMIPGRITLLMEMKVESTTLGEIMSQGIGILATIPGVIVVKALALRSMMDGETSNRILGEGTSGILRSCLMGRIHGNVALFNTMELQGRIIMLGQDSEELAAVGKHGTLFPGRGKVLISIYLVAKVPGFNGIIIRQFITEGVRNLTRRDEGSL